MVVSCAPGSAYTRPHRRTRAGVLDAHVSIEALYGTVGRTSRRRYGGVPPKLVGFSLSQDEYDAARELVSGASGPSPIALEFEEFGQEEDLGEDNDESLARYETPRGGKRKAAAQRKGTKKRQ